MYFKRRCTQLNPSPENCSVKGSISEKQYIKTDIENYLRFRKTHSLDKIIIMCERWNITAIIWNILILSTFVFKTLYFDFMFVKLVIFYDVYSLSENYKLLEKHLKKPVLTSEIITNNDAKSRYSFTMSIVLETSISFNC